MNNQLANHKYLPDFEALLKGAKAGNEAAQLEILQCFERLGFKLANISGGTVKLGEDALQITRLGILKAIGDWHEGDDIHRFAAFVANKIRTELRTVLRRQATTAYMEGGNVKMAAAAQDVQIYNDYLVSEQGRLQLWLVRECLPLLPGRQKFVIHGLLLEGKTILQLSCELRLDQRTVSLHRNRAIKKLRLLLGVTMA